MNLSQKCQYAVRSVYELAKSHGEGHIRISVIAEKQAIPQRFLENILNELKKTGLVESRRGVQGGYMLTKDPSEITIGKIIRLIDGPLEPVKCVGFKKNDCPLKDKCPFFNLWADAKRAVEGVYDGATFKHLLDQDVEINCKKALEYSI